MEEVQRRCLVRLTYDQVQLGHKEGIYTALVLGLALGHLRRSIQPSSWKNR